MLILFLAGIMAVSIGAADISDLEEAKILANEGKYEEALQKHLQFYEESKNSPGMGGVRLSYALSEWFRLSQKYPPAKKALIDTRDKNEKTLLDETGDFNNFHDLSSINNILGEEDKTLQLFLNIHKTQPKLAKFCFIIAKDLLVRKKEYQICGEYIPDPIYESENFRNFREMNLSMMKTDTKMNTVEMHQFTDKTFVGSIRQLVEILVGLGRMSEAEDIQKKALAYFDHEDIKSAITDAEKIIEKSAPEDGQ